jgi:hypothetical protein
MCSIWTTILWTLYGLVTKKRRKINNETTNYNTGDYGLKLFYETELECHGVRHTDAGKLWIIVME